MIQLFNVSVRYQRNLVLRHITLEIKKGAYIYLTGSTGAGKTTLLRTIYLDVFPEEGHIIVEGYNSLYIKRRQIPRLRRRIGIVFQDFKLLYDRSVIANVALPLQIVGENKKNIKRRALRALAEVGLSHKSMAKPDALSGGEQQRVCIARAIVNDPFIILADEPTGNLDPVTGKEILLLLKRINARGTATMIATHNYELVRQIPGQLYRLETGMLTEAGDHADYFQ